jgi:hypothetical protein
MCINGSTIPMQKILRFGKGVKGMFPPVCFLHQGRDDVTLITSLKKIQKWVGKENFASPCL